MLRPAENKPLVDIIFDEIERSHLSPTSEAEMERRPTNSVASKTCSSSKPCEVPVLSTANSCYRILWNGYASSAAVRMGRLAPAQPNDDASRV